VAILHPHRHGLFGNGEDELLTGKVTVGYSSAPGKHLGKRILFMVVSPGKIENRYLGHYKKQQKRAKPNNPQARLEPRVADYTTGPKPKSLQRSARKLS